MRASIQLREKMLGRLNKFMRAACRQQSDGCWGMKRKVRGVVRACGA